MKVRRKYAVRIALAVTVLLLFVIPWKKAAQKSMHQTGDNRKTAAMSENAADTGRGTNPAALPGDGQSQQASAGNRPIVPAEESANPSSSSDKATEQPEVIVSDEYPYNISEDREKFNPAAIDITVGDRFYMTQINDWYVNFRDYADKTVEIEGYYLNMGEKYTFVGRNGPTCPYCTGGYVDFEFQTDQDLSGFIPQETWITVTGILREGKAKLSSGREKSFYYIEAMNVAAAEHAGVNPISD